MIGSRYFFLLQRKNVVAKQFIQRYLPNAEQLANQKGLGALNRRLSDPSLWHLNRRSAAGAAFVGLFCSFLPMPFQMLPTTLLAIVFRVNLPFSILLAWASNPITILPFAWLAYFVGTQLFGMPMLSMADLKTVLLAMASTEPASNAIDLSVHIKPFVVGALSCGLIAGSIGYATVRGLWRWQTIRAWNARKKKRFMYG